jgi:hypothetical protein
VSDDMWELTPEAAKCIEWLAANPLDPPREVKPMSFGVDTKFMNDESHP